MTIGSIKRLEKLENNKGKCNKELNMNKEETISSANSVIYSQSTNIMIQSVKIQIVAQIYKNKFINQRIIIKGI